MSPATRQHEHSAQAKLLAFDKLRTVQRLFINGGLISSSYTAYGFLPYLQTSVTGFTGEYCDPTTGCYLLGNGYRAYNPQIMRFNSPDSDSPFGSGGLNCYAYVQGDPVNQSDPSGHGPRKIWEDFYYRNRIKTIYKGRGVKVDGIRIFPIPAPPSEPNATVHVVAHGGRSGKRVFGKKKSYLPQELNQLLKEAGVDTKNRHMHLMACNMAKGSYIEEFASDAETTASSYDSAVLVSDFEDSGLQYAYVIKPNEADLRIGPATDERVYTTPLPADDAQRLRTSQQPSVIDSE